MNNYIVPSDSDTEKKTGESWRETVKRWLVRCPQCEGQWLVIGARENDRYVCKDCGHDFVIRLSGASKTDSDELERDVA